MGLAHLMQSPGDQVEGLVPAYFFPAGGGFSNRPAQPFRVFMQILQRHRLRANMAPAERVVVVAFDSGNLAVLNLDSHATHGFAKVAGAVVGAVVHKESPELLFLGFKLKPDYQEKNRNGKRVFVNVTRWPGLPASPGKQKRPARRLA